MARDIIYVDTGDYACEPVSSGMRLFTDDVQSCVGVVIATSDAIALAHINPQQAADLGWLFEKINADFPEHVRADMQVYLIGGASPDNGIPEISGRLVQALEAGFANLEIEISGAELYHEGGRDITVVGKNHIHVVEDGRREVLYVHPSELPGKAVSEPDFWVREIPSGAYGGSAFTFNDVLQMNHLQEGLTVVAQGEGEVHVARFHGHYLSTEDAAAYYCKVMLKGAQNCERLVVLGSESTAPAIWEALGKQLQAHGLFYENVICPGDIDITASIGTDRNLSLYTYEQDNAVLINQISMNQAREAAPVAKQHR